MSVYALPALIALFSKLYIYHLAKKIKNTPKVFLWLLAIFAFHNLSEFLILSKIFDHQVSNNLLRIYYLASLFSVAYICIFVTEVANKQRLKTHRLVILSIACLMSLLMFSTNFIIAGAVSVSYTITAIKGPFYFAFQGVAIFAFLWVIYSLGKGYTKSLDIRVQLKCFYAAFALSPLIIASIALIILMQMGYQFGAAMLLPFTSTCFLLLVIMTEKNSDLIRIRHRLPFSRQKAEEKKILALYRSFSDGDIGLVETKTEIEKALIQSTLIRSNNNIALTANELGINRSTLYSIVNRLGINPSNS